jgi:Tol biopolymer transport system component
MRFSSCFSALVALCLIGGTVVAQTTERVSVSSSEVEGNGQSGYSFPSISGDGRNVAFDSFASNLVFGDTNRHSDIFVRDRLAGTTERVSVGSGGIEGNGESSRPSISRDGRYVAFESMLPTSSPMIPTDGSMSSFVIASME